MADHWFRIKGRGAGDRTLAEQMLALWPAVEACKHKSVLDLGCAEGLISLEFAKAGASRVLGIERHADRLEIARKLCAGYPAEFEAFNISEKNPDEPLAFDIVLALGIIHKLEFPDVGLRFAARSAGSLLLLRSGRGSVKGIIRGKYSRNTCDSAAVLREEGFELEQVVDGPPERKEPVEYWRRA